MLHRMTYLFPKSWSVSKENDLNNIFDRLKNEHFITWKIKQMLQIVSTVKNHKKKVFLIFFYSGSSIIGMTIQNKFPDNWNHDKRGISLNNICIGICTSKWIQFPQLLGTPRKNRILITNGNWKSCYFKEFLIIEELALNFSIPIPANLRK